MLRSPRGGPRRLRKKDAKVGGIPASSNRYMRGFASRSCLQIPPVSHGKLKPHKPGSPLLTQHLRSYDDFGVLVATTTAAIATLRRMACIGSWHSLAQHKPKLFNRKSQCVAITRAYQQGGFNEQLIH